MSNMGVIHGELGREREARVACGKALEARPGYLPALPHSIFHCQYILFLKVSCHIASTSCREAYLRNIYRICAILWNMVVKSGFTRIFTIFPVFSNNLVILISNSHYGC